MIALLLSLLLWAFALVVVAWVLGFPIALVAWIIKITLSGD